MTRLWEPVFALGFVIVQAVAPDAQQLSQAPVMNPGSIRPDGLELHYVKAGFVQYRGKSALRIVDAAPGHGDDVSRIAVVKNTSLLDGTIEIDLSGDAVPDASQDSRGFVGITFRVMGDVSRVDQSDRRIGTYRV